MENIYKKRLETGKIKKYSPVMNSQARSKNKKLR